MRICFVETEASEQEFIRHRLEGHEVAFARDLGAVGADVEVLSVYIHSVIDGNFLDNHPSLKLITTRSVGYDHIEMAACKQRAVTVCNACGADANTVAEHTFALMLFLSRRLREVGEANKKQTHFNYESLRGFDLKGKTLGVIGTGRIGLHTIHIALAFGMHVLAYDPYRPSLMAEILGVRYVPLDQLLHESHVLTLHVPLTAETHHLLNRESLQKCRPGVVIINTARGGLIHTEALIAAIEAGIVGGVGLDVLEDERPMQKNIAKIVTEQLSERLRTETAEEAQLKNPQRIKELQSLFRSERLLSYSNVVFTPHVAFNSVEAVERIIVVTIENIIAFSRGAPINVVT